MTGAATGGRPMRLAVAASAVAIGAALTGTAIAGAGLPPTLPETLRVTVQAPEGGIAASPADTLQELYPRLAACWEVPQGLAGFPRTEITARFALRRDGSVIGEPRITFTMQNADRRGRDILTRSTLDAIRRCTPVAITPALGAAIAGRPIALRFLYQGPKGQGV
ncbi:hypothetical protein [Methylobacterium sp. E-045]|uniref:hypothetical protein n=1 Tax=Methylobacterium sp. E-045 TaxID=2836575 RepID=UPI001FBAF0EE|nr:hypothetical protein [Methylobacterium sp. E-045]MCJ2132315.1 hypothetical protein [Methylobacterium sp. E-045]